MCTTCAGSIGPIGHWAKNYLQYFGSVTTFRPHAGTLCKGPSLCRWQPPEDGWAKVNTNASFSAFSLTGGVGVLARHSHGNILLAATFFILRIGQRLRQSRRASAIDIGFHPILLETDSLRYLRLLDGLTCG